MKFISTLQAETMLDVIQTRTEIIQRMLNGGLDVSEEVRSLNNWITMQAMRVDSLSIVNTDEFEITLKPSLGEEAS